MAIPLSRLKIVAKVQAGSPPEAV